LAPIVAIIPTIHTRTHLELVDGRIVYLKKVYRSVLKRCSRSDSMMASL
jgi:hypothetical protein